MKKLYPLMAEKIVTSVYAEPVKMVLVLLIALIFLNANLVNIFVLVTIMKQNSGHKVIKAGFY